MSGVVARQAISRRVAGQGVIFGASACLPWHPADALVRQTLLSGVRLHQQLCNLAIGPAFAPEVIHEAAMPAMTQGDHLQIL